jgi:UDP-N-acetylmuramoyl-tripeptide--D-alanyl-D-alanine ligase
MIPGNINTAIGIAIWIKKNLEVSTEVLVVEMGAYVKGEIEKSCTIVSPDISIITYLGDQHLERFGGFENLVRAKLEIFRGTKNGGIRIIPDRFKSILEDAKYDISEVTFVDDTLPSYLGKEMSVNSELVSFTPNLALALKVAEILNVPRGFVEDSIGKLRLPDRRKQIIDMYGYEVLDDSYNISFSTALEALKNAKELAIKKGKRLVVVTAGIPELGGISKLKNGEYGKKLSNLADHIVLLNSILAKEIITGFDTSTLDRTKRADDMQKAWEVISSSYEASEVFILLQPELTDSYY